MKFEIFQNEGKDKFYFRLKAKNGQIILASQGYANKAGAKNGIESVKTNGTDESRFEVKESSNGKFYFNLLAANKQIIGNSQMYASMDGCRKGMKSVMNTVGEATVEDLTE